MGLFIKKPFAALQAEAYESGNKTLKRVLGPWSLIALGVGVIIGAGLFSITGTVAAGYTGPAITLSFAIAAIGCCFAGLCFAEFHDLLQQPHQPVQVRPHEPIRGGILGIVLEELVQRA